MRFAKVFFVVFLGQGMRYAHRYVSVMPEDLTDPEERSKKEQNGSLPLFARTLSSGCT